MASLPRPSGHALRVALAVLLAPPLGGWLALVPVLVFENGPPTEAGHVGAALVLAAFGAVVGSLVYGWPTTLLYGVPVHLALLRGGRRHWGWYGAAGAAGGFAVMGALGPGAEVADALVYGAWSGSVIAVLGWAAAYRLRRTDGPPQG